MNLTRMEEGFFGENASAWFVDLQLVFIRANFAYYIGNGSEKHVYGILEVTRVYNRTPHYNVEASDFLAHEFAHSFVNPAVDRHYDLFKPYKALPNPVSSKLRIMAYKNFKVMLYETFVRAFVVHYLNVTEGPDAAMTELRTENVTFYFIGDIYNAYVNDYMKHRNKYRTFDDFMPELAKVIEKVYRKTDGGKKVRVPYTLYDFYNQSKEGGIIVAYENNTQTEKMAKYLGMLFEHYKVNVTLKRTSDISEEDLRGNLVLVVLSDSPLLKELRNSPWVTVNGTTVHSNVTGKTYRGSLRVVEILRNPWNPEKLMMAVAGTDERAFYSINGLNWDTTYIIAFSGSGDIMEGA